MLSNSWSEVTAYLRFAEFIMPSVWAVFPHSWCAAFLAQVLEELDAQDGLKGVVEGLSIGLNALLDVRKRGSATRFVEQTLAMLATLKAERSVRFWVFFEAGNRMLWRLRKYNWHFDGFVFC